jgi:phenylpyruvate tautomerase PptA (4-oxalocrotonate tautomerase family)
MPDILAEVRGSWLQRRQSAFLRAVHQAVVEALGTPPDEPLARLIEHAPDCFMTPHAAGNRFTRVEIVLFGGRSLNTKRQLYRAVTEHLRPFEVPSDDVKIVLIEVASQDVGFRGGQAACDVDLGYAVAV